MPDIIDLSVRFKERAEEKADKERVILKAISALDKASSFIIIPYDVNTREIGRMVWYDISLEEAVFALHKIANSLNSDEYDYNIEDRDA